MPKTTGSRHPVFKALPGAAIATLALLILAFPARAATVTWDGGGDTTWSTAPDATSWSGGTYNAGDDAEFLGAGAGTVTLAGTITPGSVTVDSASDYTFTGSALGGAGGITKAGTGRLTLNNDNTYAGVTNINNGDLRITTDDALGSTAGETVVSTTTNGHGLEVGTGVTSAEAITINTTRQASIESVAGAGGATLTGAVTLNTNADFRGGPGNRLTFSGGINSGPAGTENRNLSLNLAATIDTSPIDLNAGILTITSNSNSAATATELDVGGNDWGNMRINFGGYLTLGGNDFMPADSGVEFGWSTDAFSAGTLDLNGFDQTVAFLRQTSIFPTVNGDQNVTGGGTLTVDLASGDADYHGRITDGATATSLVKTGDGRQILDNQSGTASSYTGTTTILDGELRIATDDALGSTAGETIVSTTAHGDGLEVAAGVTSAEAITINSPFQGSITSVAGAGGATLAGPVTLNTNADFRGGPGNRLTFSGGINSGPAGTENRNLSLNLAATIDTSPIDLNDGVMTFTSNSNNIATATRLNVAGNDWGLTRINFGGYVLLGADDAMPTDTRVSFGWHTVGSSAGTLDLNGFDQTVASLDWPEEINPAWKYPTADRSITDTGGGGTLTVNPGPGTFTYLGNFEGDVSLVKTGAGTQILENVNASTNDSGAITVDEGTLQVGVLGVGTTVADTTAVNSGGTLAGSGTVGNSATDTLTVNGGAILAPGDSGGADIGTLTVIGTTTLDSGSTTTMQISSALGLVAGAFSLTPAEIAAAIPTGLDPTTEHDALHITGGILDLASGATIVVDDSLFAGSYAKGMYFDLFDGLITDGGANLVLPSLSTYSWDLSLFASEGIIFLIPEPSRAVLLVLGAAGLAFRRRTCCPKGKKA